jgi:hypothetical protein
MATLVTAINAWEANKGYLTKITGKKMDEEDERFILIQMCPEALESYLRKDSTKWPTYHDVKYEIFDYISRTASKKRVGALNEASHWCPPGLHEPEWDQNLHEHWQEEEYQEAHYDQREVLASIMTALPEEYRESLAAVFKHNFQKKGKGKGKKGGGKSDEERQPRKGPGPDNKCHECGSDQHFKRDCPIHIGKMEAKGKGKGKSGGKGGGKSPWSPTLAWWNQQYPGPDKKL